MGIIKRAGVSPWPKIFQNLRASRETELANQFPLHVVTEWLGNTPSVATKHYLQVTDAHYEEAVKVGAGLMGATLGAVSGGKGMSANDSCTTPHLKNLGKPRISGVNDVLKAPPVGESKLPQIAEETLLDAKCRPDAGHLLKILIQKLKQIEP